MKNFEEGLNCTEEIRKMGKERLDKFAHIELHFALRRIYKWNYKHPYDRGAEILLKHDETANKLKALGYRNLFYTGRNKGKKKWYNIEWEGYNKE